VLDPPYVCVLARPSAELAKKLIEEEEKRLEKQVHKRRKRGEKKFSLSLLFVIFLLLFNKREQNWVKRE
jgi:hypothetical protein